MARSDILDDLVHRGVAQIIVRESLAEKLRSRKPLRIKLGIDPTAPFLHIGHAVILRAMRKLQDAGHTIIFLVGDFTARIGDPSGKEKARKPLTDKDITANMKSYRTQAGMILDLKKTEFRYNSEWWKNMDFAELFDILSLFSVQRMLERDMFQLRIKKDRPIWIHELLYPVMQGYDSVALKADVELGGTDQTFNLLAGRVVQPRYGQVAQDVITFDLLEGLDGKDKMSMSIGNTINLTDTAEEMYGKTMSVPDSLILKYFRLCTDVPEDEVKQLEQDMKKGANPKTIKERLAGELVTLYHGKAKADKAHIAFQNVYGKKGTPDKVDTVTSEPLNVTSAVAKLFSVSKTEARRLVMQKSVHVNDVLVTDPNADAKEGVYKKGRFFKKLKLKK